MRTVPNSMLSALPLALLLSACSSSLSTGAGVSSMREGASAVVHQLDASSAVRANSADTASSAKLFVANGRANSVDIYQEYPPHHVLGQITDGITGPNAMAVDAAGDLFVSNVDSQTVTVYPPGSTSPSRTYTRGFNKRLTNPLTVALGRDGTMYLVNYTHVGMRSEILIYPPDQLKPSTRIQLNGGADGLAVDPSNNIYVSVNTNRGGRVLKFSPGSKTGQDLGISVGFAGGIALDKNLDLLVCDQTAPAIDVFPPGATQPSNVLKAPFINPYGLAFGTFFQRLYVADSAGDTVYIFSYPDGALIGHIHRSHTAFGIAVSPAAPI